jgi:hypothetical protein
VTSEHREKLLDGVRAVGFDGLGGLAVERDAPVEWDILVGYLAELIVEEAKTLCVDLQNLAA